MKKLIFFSLIFIFLCAAAWGMEYTWTGADNDGDWKNPNNWEVGNGSPAASYPGGDENDDIVIIENGSVVLNISVTIESLSIRAGGELTLGEDLTVTDDVTIDDGGTLDLGSQTVDAVTIINNGTLTLVGAVDQLLGGSHMSMDGTVVFTGSGLTMSGITDFFNLTIRSGVRTGGGLIVGGNFTHNGSLLTADSLSVTGTSIISANITTSGNQTYSTVFFSGSAVQMLESTGGSIEAEEITNSGNLTINAAAGRIAIGNGGIAAGTGTVSLNAGQEITSGGPITTTTSLTAAASGGITLNNANNNVNSLTVTGAGGAVSFKNNAALTVAGVSVTGNNNVSITTSDSITIDVGGITADGVVTLQSTNGDIEINGVIIAGQLILRAEITSRAVTVGNSIDITVTSDGTEGTSAAIYVIANSFTANGGTGNIKPGDIGQLCLYVSSYTISDDKIKDERYHTHGATPHQNAHLVYYTATVPAGFINDYNPINFVDSSTVESSFTVGPNFNIFIVDVGTNTSNPLVTFISNGAGFIEVRGSYSATGITLSAATDGIQLGNGSAGVNINLSGDFIIGNNSKLILVGANNTIAAANMTLNAIESNASQNNNLTLNGSVVIAISGNVGQTDHLGVFSVTGNSEIGGNITTTGTQSYGGAVTLGGAGTRVLTSTSGSVTVTGKISETVTGSGLTVDALRGITMNAANALSGNITLNNNQPGTASGNISFNNNSASINLTANNDASGTINVNQTGTLNVTEVTSRMGAVTLSGTEGIAINGAIDTTSGGTAGAAIILTSSDGGVTGTGVLTGTTLTVNAQDGIMLNAANQISTSVELNNTGGSPGHIEFVNSSAYLSLTAANSAGNITVTQTGSLTVGTVRVTSSGGAISLMGTTGITANNAVSADTEITFSSTGGAVNGTGRLTGTELTVSANGGISLTNTANSVTTVSLTNNGSTGGITYNNNSAAGLTTTAVNNAASGGDITITEAEGNLAIENGSPAISTGTSQGAVRLTAAGSITVNGNIGNGNGAVTLTSGDDKDITINGTINCYSLSLIAGDFDSNSTMGTVTISAEITVASTSVTHDTNAAVFIQTGTLKGDGNIHLPPSGGWVCVFFFVEYDFKGAVTGNSNPDIIHTHAGGGKSIVYSIGSKILFTADPAIPEDFVYMDAENSLGVSISASGSGNIYIIGIESGNVKANTRSVVFSTVSGFIEIRDNYYSSGTLTLNSGSGVIRLRNAEIELTNAPFNTNGAGLTLLDGTDDKNSITASAIILGAVEGSGIDLSLKSAGSISINGAVGSLAPLGAITVDSPSFSKTATGGAIMTAGGFTQEASSGTSTLAAGITATAVNAGIAFSNEVRLEESVTLAANAGNVSLSTVTSTSGRSFVINAGTGDVKVSGYIGTDSARLGDVTITGKVIELNVVDIDGKTTITNSGIFTANAPIVSNGGFEQNGAGNNILGTGIARADITANGKNITFNTEITLLNDIHFSTGTGAGDILLKGNIVNNSTPGNITLTAGTGDIAVTGSVGSSADPLGAITVDSVKNLTFSGEINAASFTQSAGTGAATFNGAQNYSSGFSFTGGALTVNSVLAANGAVSINNSGAFIVGVSGSVTPDGAAGTITVTGDTVNNGKITAAPVASDTRAIYFRGNYTSGAAGLLTGSSSTTPEIHFGAGVVLGALEQKNNRLVFTGSASHELNIASGASPVLDGVLIERGNTVELMTGAVINQANGKNLELEGESSVGASDGAVLDTSAGSWHMGTSVTLNDFAGINGALKLGTGSKLISRDLNLAGPSFTVENTGWAAISVKGDVIIGASVDFQGDHPQLILEMAGSGNQSLATAQALGSLHVEPGSQTNLRNDLTVTGEVQIKYSAGKQNGSLPPPSPYGILYAGNFNIEMYAGLTDPTKGKVSRWEIINAPEYVSEAAVSNYSMNAFRQNDQGKVEFKKDPLGNVNDKVFFEIIGNTVWQRFICKEPGAIIQFSTNPDHHVFLYTFEVNGQPGLSDDDFSRYITLTRLPPKGTSWVYEYDGSIYPPDEIYGIPNIPASRNLKAEDDDEKNKFWNFNLVPPSQGQILMNIGYVTIFFSHAWNQRIPIAVETMRLNAIPYYGEDGLPPPRNSFYGFFNYDWVEVRKIIYSFVEDGNGNGKADRIRVQTNIPLNGDFSQFNVAVEGYRVDTSRGYKGFALVSNALGSPAGNNDIDSFYIYIEEPLLLYDGSTITWRVTENNSLKDGITKTLLVWESETDGEYFKTINTIPPRISYALTLPGHNQTYFRISQPVTTDSNSVIDGDRVNGYREIDSIPPDTVQLEYYFFEGGVRQIDVKIPEGILSYLLELGYEPAVSELTALPAIGGRALNANFFNMRGFTDLGVRALDWHDEKVDPFDHNAYMYYPSPKYPVDWNYSEYKSYSGNGHIKDETLSGDDAGNPNVFLPPNRLLTPEMMRRLEDYAAGNKSEANKVKPGEFDNGGDLVTRRITDVLVSRTPTNTSYENYFAWPVWARYADPSMHFGLTPGSNFWGQQDTDNGIIWVFDGTQFLETRDITLQARINNNLLSDITGLSLFFAADVPVEWRYPSDAGVRGRGSGGLWLPELFLNKNPLFNIVPGRTANIYSGLLSFYPAAQQTVPSSGPLFNFNIEKDKFTSGGKLDFLLRLEGKTGVDPYLFVARLDAPSGVNLSAVEWWKLIRPFSFDIQEIRLQRGGVTILNNVINSDAREITYIRYHLVRSGRVTIQVYTLDGTLVKSIRRNEYRDVGEWTDVWDGTNNGGRAVARGMYFVRIVAPDIDEIRKIMVVR